MCFISFLMRVFFPVMSLYLENIPMVKNCSEVVDQVLRQILESATTHKVVNIPYKNQIIIPNNLFIV